MAISSPSFMTNTKGAFFEDAGIVKWDFKADYQSCEYLALIADLNCPATVIRAKPKHILTITGNS